MKGLDEGAVVHGGEQLGQTCPEVLQRLAPLQHLAGRRQKGEHDCADFVAAVLRERFGRELALPAHAASVRGWDAQIAALKGEFALPTISPQEGDGVLMRAAARRRSVGHHIGVWCAVGAEPYVLHCLRGTGSIFHPIRELRLRALALEGVYRWL